MNRVRTRLAAGAVTALVASAGLVLGVAAPASAASTCVGFIPLVIETQAQLTAAVTAAQSGSCPGADTIDLGGNTIVLTASGESTFFQISTPLTITNGTILASGTPSARLFSVTIDGVFAVTSATLAGGNSDTSGGGIFVATGGTLTVTDSTLIDNHTGGNGGAILNNGTTTITRSAIVDGSANSGGAIHNVGTLTVSNSTIAGNVADEGDGSAIQSAGVAATIINSTIVENTGLNAVYLFLGTLGLSNSIIANNFGAPGCVRENGTTVTFSPGATNLIEDDGGCGTAGVNYLTGDPGIAPGAGAVYHFRPIAGSPIINGGDNASAGGATVDQRGEARILEGTVDLGSIERLPQAASVQFAAATSSAPENSGFTPSFILSTSDSEPLVSSVQFTFERIGGTASAADYAIADAGVVIVPAGTADDAVLPLTPLTIVGDDAAEPDETLQLRITAASGTTVAAPGATTHTILNDDAPKLAATGVDATPLVSGALALLALGGALGVASRRRSSAAG